MDDLHYTFDVLGLLDGVFQMRDRQTGSIWTHLDGKANSGPASGQRLDIIPAPQMTWTQWQEQHPDTVVLSDDTPYKDRYRPARIGVFNRSYDLFGDDRLPSNTLVVAVEVNDTFKGYPIDTLSDAGGVANDVLAGVPVMVFYDAVSQAGLAFARVVDGEVLEFYNASTTGLELRDRGTDSLWNLGGEAVSGPMAGKSLVYVSSFISEWYGWSAYHPETAIWEE